MRIPRDFFTNSDLWNFWQLITLNKFRRFLQLSSVTLVINLNSSRTFFEMRSIVRQRLTLSKRRWQQKDGDNKCIRVKSNISWPCIKLTRKIGLAESSIVLLKLKTSGRQITRRPTTHRKTPRASFKLNSLVYHSRY